MEIMFKNTIVRNKEMVKEIYRFYYFKRKIVILCHVLFAISLLANVALAIMGKSYSTFVFVAVPLFVALQFFCYFRQVNVVINRDLEVHGKEIEVETVVTQDYIEYTTSTGSVSRVEYDKFKTAIITKNLILLHSKANMIYMFRKDAFEIGTKEEFISFLKSKGIKIKGKQ
jgi:hypothetical protein